MTVGVASTSTSGYSSSARGQGAASTNVSDDKEDVGYTVAELRKQYTEFLSAKNSEIEEQRLHRHYYHGDQLTKTQLDTLSARGQPATIRDKASRKINGIVGLLERMRQDPKAFARTPKHEPGAEVATAVVRYICDVNNWRALSAGAALNGAINGIYGVEFDLPGGDKGDPDVGMNEVDNDTFFYDPRSFRSDFSDARYMGVAKWLDEDVAIEMFPDAEDEVKSLVSHGQGSESWQQRDRELKWTDSTRKRIFLVEHWYVRKSEWHVCYYCGDTKLESFKSPFFDEKDKSTNRYVMG